MLDTSQAWSARLCQPCMAELLMWFAAKTDTIEETRAIIEGQDAP